MENFNFLKNVRFIQRETEQILNQPKGYLIITVDKKEYEFLFYIYPVPKDGIIDIKGKYISLGDENYYKFLNKILSDSDRDSWYKSVGDIAYNPTLIDTFRNNNYKKYEPSIALDLFNDNFFQFITENTIRGRLHRISHGKEQYIKYNLHIRYKNKNILDIQVNQELVLPNNIYAIIGKNGVGKSFLLRQIASALLRDNKPIKEELVNDDELFIDQEDDSGINNLLFISYSPFDHVGSVSKNFNTKFIGLGNKFYSTSYFAVKENFEKFLFEQLKNKLETEPLPDDGRFLKSEFFRDFDLKDLKLSCFHAQTMGSIMDSRYRYSDEGDVIWEFINGLTFSQQYQLYKGFVEYNKKYQEIEDELKEDVIFHQKHLNQIIHDIRYDTNLYEIFMAVCTENPKALNIIMSLQSSFENEECRVSGSENSVLEDIKHNYEKIIESDIEKIIFKIIYSDLGEKLELQIAYLMKTLINRNNIDRKNLLINVLDNFEKEEYLYTFIEHISEINDSSFENFVSFAKKLSSGQKIVLMSLMEISLFFDEKSVLLIDEPELFLHPSLLKSYIRSLSIILKELNGFSILTTHTPLTLQEIPNNCVYEMYRKKDNFELKSVDYKTFGENISELMKNVYGVYLADTGYSNLIDNIFNEGIINSMTDEEKKELEEAMGREAMIKYKLLMSKRQQ